MGERVSRAVVVGSRGASWGGVGADWATEWRRLWPLLGEVVRRVWETEAKWRRVFGSGELGLK